MATVLILGSTSSIARAVAAEFASRNYDLILAGRDLEETDAVARDLALRYGVRARAHPFDVLAFETHGTALDACLADAGDSLEGAILAIGYLGDHALAERDPAEARRILDTNYTGCVSTLNILGAHFEQRRRGFICAVSSVAGDRGRGKNYLYGSAKAALSAYLQGMRQRLFRANVRVITIKPGFVDTRMIYGRPDLFLVASSESVGKDIFRAISRGKDVAYVPWFWRPIMFVVRTIPERLFKRIYV